MQAPTRTIFLARAWMVWRARKDGWADQNDARKRVFADEAARLQRDVRRFQPQAGRCLGDPSASAVFTTLVLDVATVVNA